METAYVITTVPAAMQVNWECEGSFPSKAAGRHRLLHDLGVSLATCCPFYTKVACVSQQEQALTSLGRSKQSSGAQWSSLAEQSGLEHVKCLWVGLASHTASTTPACWHRSCLLALPVPAPGIAITMATYTRHGWTLLLQGAWVKIALSKWLSVWFLFKHLCNINWLQKANNEWRIK